MAKRLSVVVSQSPSKNPAKRKLEEDIVAGMLFENGIDVTIVPNLYDIKPDSTGMLALQQIKGNLVVCSWLFERAAHWVLDRNGIHGHVGQTLIQNEDEDEDDDEATSQGDSDADDDADDKPRVIDTREVPNRKIYCLDLKSTNDLDTYVEEIKRIHRENAVQVVGLNDLLNGVSAPAASAGNGNGRAMGNGHANGKANGNSNGHANGNGALPVLAAANDRMQQPTNDTALAADGSGLDQPTVVNRIESSGGRRWYPVIDFSRCTNCMECIDFCLFGVYGVDQVDTILVEQPDNCRKGCPACSRVCPENAIMFPQHKTPAIAGSSDTAESMKIDLSALFGAPAEGKSAEEVAAMERDEQLIAAGRDAVGLPTRQSQEKTSDERDELDDLVDQLDDFS